MFISLFRKKFGLAFQENRGVIWEHPKGTKKRLDLLRSGIPILFSLHLWKCTLVKMTGETFYRTETFQCSQSLYLIIMISPTLSSTHIFPTPRPSYGRWEHHTKSNWRRCRSQAKLCFETISTPSNWGNTLFQTSSSIFGNARLFNILHRIQWPTN